MSTKEAWICVERLFKIYDRAGSGALNLDQLVDFVGEVRKMDIVDVDEPHIVEKLQETNAEQITFEEFKSWSHGPEGPAPAVNIHVDPFGNKNIVPDRFISAQSFVQNVKVQHPCFTTAAHEIGMKKPNQVDMPMKWRGKAGDFTRDFEMREPGKSSITVNNFVNRGLRTNKTFSKVHSEFDIDW